ncbi:phage neck terminator protein [Paenibacillus sp. EC2-1]|uniref:phage neck terminator protein n=1 Tax=Paenibacillus sp. EC2-1 TaxID=3388665 RepID=UPI003BEEC2E8
MIPFEEIRKVMIEGLSSAVGVPVIEISGTGDVPAYPFLSYDFTDEGSPHGHMAVTVENNKTIHSGTVALSVTFQSYAKTRLESVNLANRARDWFETTGHRILKENVNVVVVDVGATTNTDIQLGTEWERRNGFEVECRTVNIIEEEYTPIESVYVRG